MDSSDEKRLSTPPILSQDSALPRFLKNLVFPIAVLKITDNQTIITFVNPAFVQTFGYTQAEIPTVAIWATKAYPDAAYRTEIFDSWDRDVAQAISNQGVLASREVEVVTKDGSLRQVVINATAFDQSLIVAFVDISQQREAEAELRNARFFLERTAYELTENIPVGTYTMVQPADGGMAYFKFMSTRFLELTGLEREEARRDPLKGFACVHPEDFDDWVKLNTEAFTQCKRFFGETRVVVKGEVRWITAESIPRSLPDGSTVWEGVLADITERKLAEQALVAAKVKAEELEQIKTDFLAHMSHEIRTPLTTLLGLTQLLETEDLLPAQHNKIVQIQGTGKLLLGIVNDLLDLSKIEAGQLAIDALPFQLEPLVQRVIDTQAATIEGDVVLTASLPSPPLPRLSGDARRLEQILTNLISNAVKFTEHGSISVNVDVLTTTANNAHLRFTIKDTGIGIDRKALNRLFEPFAQAEAGISRRYGGTGLGLSISKQLVELMDGTIGVDSQLGEGSQFWVELRLPFAQDTTSQVARRRENENENRSNNINPSNVQLTGLRLLVVDDSHSIRWLVSEFLAQAGITCELVQNGTQALAALRKASHTFDAVLMDIQMPVMDGLTATRLIRTDLGLVNLPIFAMTAGLLAEQQARVREVGVNDVIPKPIDFDQMMKTIDRHTQSSPRRQPHWTLKPSVSGEQTAVESNTRDFLPFPVIEGIDLMHARGTMDGNADFYRRLLQLFVDEFESTTDLFSVEQSRDKAIRDSPAKEQKDLDWAQSVHSLCGAASQIGAIGVYEKARTLEKSLRAHSPDIETQLTDLQIELKNLTQQIRAALEK